MKAYKMLVGLVISGVMLTMGVSSTYAYSGASETCEKQHLLQVFRACEEPSRSDEAAIGGPSLDNFRQPEERAAETSDVDWWLDVLTIQCGGGDVWVEIETDDNGNETVVNGGCF